MMENFLSLLILTFIIIYLVYDFTQKRNKGKKEKSNVDTQTKDNKSVVEDTNNIKTTEDELIGSEKPSTDPAAQSFRKEEGVMIDSEPGQSDPVLEEGINLKIKIQKIEEIVQKGLFGGENKEQCLIEIKKVITNHKNETI